MYVVCVFKVSNTKCAILTKKECSRCSFCKTREELEEGRKKVRERIANLPVDVKTRIQEKYGNTDIKEDNPNDTV